MVYKRVFEREYLMLGVKSPTDIEGIYNSYLDELQEKNRKERYEGKESWYHASGAGSCSR